MLRGVRAARGEILGAAVDSGGIGLLGRCGHSWGLFVGGRYADGPCQFAVDEAEVFDLTFGREPVVKAPVRGSCRSCGHVVNLVVQQGWRVSSGT